MMRGGTRDSSGAGGALVRALVVVLGLWMIANAAGASRLPPGCEPVGDAELEKLRDLDFPGEGARNRNIDLFSRDPARAFDRRSGIGADQADPRAMFDLSAGGGTPRGGLSVNLTRTGRGCSFAAIFAKDPEPHLEPGDILINLNPKIPQDSGGLYTRLTNGMSHAAIVVREKDGSLSHVDSPLGMSGKDFRSHGAFHVVRLRRVPPEVGSSAELDAWLKDPAKREKLREFASVRACLIAGATSNAIAMRERGFKYGISPDNMATMDPLFKRRLTQSNAGIGNIYCSELVMTAYRMAGLTPTAARDLGGIAQRIEGDLSQTAVREGITRDEAAENGLIALWLEVNGITGKQAAIARKLARGSLSESEKAQLSSVAKGITGSPEEIRRAVESGKGTDLQILNEKIVGPFEIFADVARNPNSPFVYGGTYLPERSPSLERDPEGPVRPAGCR